MTMINQRFLLDDDGYIIDKLNAANNKKAEWFEQLGYKNTKTVSASCYFGDVSESCFPSCS